MPFSLGAFLWPTHASFFTNTCTPSNSSITHKFPPSKFANLSTITYNTSLYQLKISFNLTHTHSNLTTTQITTLSFQEKETETIVEHFAEKISKIPVQERPKFLTSIIENHAGSKTIAYFNDLIMGLMRAEEFHLALKVFDEMPLYGVSPDGWTYSMLISCYCKQKEPHEGKRLLDLMIEHGFRPNIVTLTILVNAFCSRGKVQRALEVLELMDRFGCKPNIRSYNCLLKGLCFVGRVEEAYDMLMTLKRKDSTSSNCISPDLYSYTAVMDGLCKVGRSDEAMELLNEAIGIGLTPNVITYNTLFQGYCKEGHPRKGIKLLKLMKQRGCEPDYVSYSTLLHGLLKWRKIMAAFWVYKEMVKIGLKVDERMLNTLLRGLCRKSWKEEGLFEAVYQVFDQMKSWGYAIYPDSHYLVIQTYCVGREVDKALVNLYGMIEAGYFPKMVTINRIIRGLCEEGNISEALSVLVLVSESSKIPSKISYNILIDEFNRQKDLLAASSVYGAALKLGVWPHKKPMSVTISKDL